MKHPWRITAILILLFFTAQVVGLWLVAQNQEVIVEDGTQRVHAGTTAIGERPDLEGGQSLAYLAVGIALGTVAMLAIIRLRALRLWKAWFVLAVWLALGVAFGVLMPVTAALILALILAIWKVWRPGPVIHNLTEIFLYGGITVLLAPLFTLGWAIAMLALISVYDMVAVWWSKHMVTLAKAQTEHRLFAGLYLPKAPEKTRSRTSHGVPLPPPSHPRAPQMAILGGGDVAFPMIFGAVVLTWLIEARQVVPHAALLWSMAIPLGATVALATLFFYSKKGRFYPAMPFLSLGCMAGLCALLIVA